MTTDMADDPLPCTPDESGSTTPAAVAGETNPSRSYDPGAGWRMRFFAIFTGQALSTLGSAIAQFVLMWWITVTAGSVSALATAGMAALLPQAALSLVGGIVADRQSRRLLMIVPDLVSAACIVVLIATFLGGGLAVWHVYTALAVRSAAQAFQTPAAAASVAMLVPTSFLPRAAALEQMLLGLTTLISAALGALVLAILPLTWALAIDLATCLCGVAPLLRYAVPQHEPPARAGAIEDLSKAAGLIWHDPGLRRLYLLLTIVTMLLMPTFTLVPLLVRIHFGGGAPAVALLETLAGLGMIAGGLAGGWLTRRSPMIWAVGGLMATGLALGLTGLAPRSQFIVAAAAWAFGSMTLILGNTPLVAVLQQQIPNQLQGRSFAILNTALALAAPLGLAAATPLGDWIGIRWLFVACGLLGALACLPALFSRSLASLDRRGSRASPSGSSG